jgi:hypothetical protein
MHRAKKIARTLAPVKHFQQVILFSENYIYPHQKKSTIFFAVQYFDQAGHLLPEETM